MNNLQEQLRQAEQNFNYADDEFIDAAIYELNAAEEKFSAILREEKVRRNEKSQNNISKWE